MATPSSFSSESALCMASCEVGCVLVVVTKTASFAAKNLASDRAVKINFAPTCANAMAEANPSPVLAPVINTVRPFKEIPESTSAVVVDALKFDITPTFFFKYHCDQFESYTIITPSISIRV